MGSSEKPRLAAGAFLLAVIAIGAGLSVFDPALFKAGPAPFLDGTWTAGWQDGYEKSLPLRDGAIALWMLLRYSLFREARPEVLVGADGWLFSAEEWNPPDLAVPLDDAKSRVDAVHRALAARGIDLVIALVPTKAAVHGDRLGRYSIPPRLQDRYAGALAAFRGLGIVAPDLLTPLRAAAGSADMYMRTDTHWTPRGARLAAETLAAAVVPLLLAHDSPRAVFTSQPVGTRRVEGDLLKFVPLGPWQRHGPRPDIVDELATISEEGNAASGGLFDDLEIPVALVGTSYSANQVSGFEGALKDALDADVLNVAVQGQGPFAPMEGYLSSPAIEDPAPDVVVWEIPERYLSLP